GGVEILRVPPLLGATVHCIVLRGGDGLVIFGIVALQPGNEGIGDFARQIGVLAIGFLAAPPARIAENIDVWGPDRQPLVETARPAGMELVDIFGAEVFGNDRGDVMQPLAIESGGNSDGLREYGGDAGPRDAGKPLVPPSLG